MATNEPTDLDTNTAPTPDQQAELASQMEILAELMKAAGKTPKKDPLALVKQGLAFVAELEGAQSRRATRATTGPLNPPAGSRAPLRRRVVDLSDREVAMCAEKKIDPAKYLAKKRAFKAKKGGVS